MQTDALLTIAGMALVTYFTRAGGFWLLDRVKRTPQVDRWLRSIPGAILISIVAPLLLEEGPAEWVAAITTVIVATSRNVLLALFAGVGMVLLARSVL